jgi:hypothetical protein
MRFLSVALVLLTSPLFAESEAATAALKRFAELGKKAESITKESSEKDVVSILGEPLSKGNGGWVHPDRKVWHYLCYTDDSLHRSFAVWFDPEAGCSVSKLEISRAELAKSPLVVSTGKVIDVYPDYPEKGGEGFYCTVRFKQDARDVTLGEAVAVATLDRVKGKPKIGATVRVEQRGPGPDYIFLGAHALYLESMVFSDKGENPPSEGGKPSK